MATDRNVNKLARWMHDALWDYLGISEKEKAWSEEEKAWKKVGEEAKARYRAVARKMLEAPPDVLRKAVREIERSEEK